MERTRTRTTVNPRVDYFTTDQTYTPQHGWSTPASAPAPGVQTTTAGQLTETTTDHVSLNYKKRIANGEIINNPFYRIKVEETNTPPGAFYQEWAYNVAIACTKHVPTQYHTGTKMKWVGTWRPGSCTPLALSSETRVALREEVTDLAVTEAFANIDPSAMLALVSAAETSKTIDSMTQICKRVIKILRHVRKLNLRALAGDLSPKQLSQDYMAARYAIRPLYYDARGLMRGLARGHEKIRETYRGSAQATHTASDTLSNVQVWTYITGSWNRTLSYEVSAKAGVLCAVDVGAVNTWGIDQIAETAWELVPFSFIADWFGNTGNWIAAHTPNAGVNQLASWVTVKETLITTQTLVSVTNVPPSNASAVGLSMTKPTWRREEQVLQRSVDPRIGAYPRFDLNLDVYKLLDLGIILKNILK